MKTLALKIVGFVVLGTIIGTLFGWEGWLSFAIGTVFADLVQPSLLQNYRVILSGRRVEALCEGGGTRHALFLAHRQFLGEFEGMLGALPGNLIVAAAAAGSGIR